MVTVNTENAKIVLAKAIDNLQERADYHDQLHYDDVKNSVWCLLWLFVPIKHWFKPKQDSDIRAFMEDDIWNKHHCRKLNRLYDLKQTKRLLIRLNNHEAMTYDLSDEEFNLYEWGLF